MDKFSINLLPEEVLLKEKDHLKTSFLTKISLIFLSFVISIAVLALFLTIYQKQQLQEANKELTDATSKVQNLKDQEAIISHLKQRLDNIAILQSQDSKQVQSYYLMQALTPPNLVLSAFSLNKNGQIIISANSDDTQTVKTLFNNLTDPVINQKKITKVQIDSLNRSVSGQIHLDLTITGT